MLDFKYQLKIKPLLLLKYLPLIALVLLPLLPELAAVDDPTRVSISANKNNYEEGEIILLTISVSRFNRSDALKTEIRINETLIAIDEKNISENGKYTFEFLAEGPFLDEEGIITASVFLRDATDTTQFNFKPHPPKISTPTIEKPITIIENNPKIIRIASVSKILGCDTTNSCFIPDKVTIEKGSQVKWVNGDSTHIITGGIQNYVISHTFDSGLIIEDFIMNFDESGIYPYYCTVHPWMQGTIIVETAITNLPKIDPAPVASKPVVTEPTEMDSVSKGTIPLSPPKVNSKPIITKNDVKSSVSKYIPSPKVISETIIPKPVVTSSPDKSPPLISGSIIVIVLFVMILFLIVRKFKKPTKNYNYEEEKNRKDYERNKKRSEDHHRRQEEERQRWEREKYNRQDNKQEKKQKQQKKQKEEKQYTESNKTEFSVTEALDILSVNHSATSEMIKKAQREMVLKYHPDKHKSTIQKKHAESIMKNINIAFETLQRAKRV